MRLTTDELPELPLPAAWMGDDGTLIAQTPEWTGGGADSIQYRCGPLHLVAETGEHSPAIAELTALTLTELDAITAAAPSELTAVRRALCAALRLVMGAPDRTSRDVNDVLTTVVATASEENVTVTVDAKGAPAAIDGGDTVAMVLKQLATNARKHDEAREIRLIADERGAFRLTWNGTGTTGAIATSRHPDHRERWGLGLVRLAADALGASVIPARPLGDGRAEAVFAPDTAQGRFTLPLAAISDTGVIERATRAWDEETGQTPGTRLRDDGLLQLWEMARGASGRCVERDTFVARAGHRRTWISLAPRSTREFARDLVAGVAHERALVGDGMDGTRLVGVSAALNCLLGEPAEMWLMDAFREALPAACTAFGVSGVAITGDGRAAPCAPLVAFLAAQGGGGRLELSEDGWFFAPRRWNTILEELLSREPIPA